MLKLLGKNIFTLLHSKTLLIKTYGFFSGKHCPEECKDKRGKPRCWGPKSHLCQYGKFRGASLGAGGLNHTSVNMVSSEGQA